MRWWLIRLLAIELDFIVPVFATEHFLAQSRRPIPTLVIEQPGTEQNFEVLLIYVLLVAKLDGLHSTLLEEVN